jgi:MarR family transcriptional regulator for hemolysin
VPPRASWQVSVSAELADGPPRGPREEPVGILIARTGKVVDRAFDEALATSGGSRATWLILLAVKSGSGRTQARIAERLGLSRPTVTHHLDHLEAAGLVVRSVGPGNRRLNTVTLTAAGDDLFVLLRDAAVGFDQRLRHGLDASDIAALRRLLGVVHHNAL